MRQTMARRRGLTATLRRRWWIFPIVLLLVAAALVFRALSAPLTVSASVADGDHAVVRSSSVALSFNQDMDVGSVTKGFRISPSVAYTVTVKGPRVFDFHPQLEPDTAYRVQVNGARKAVGFGSENYSVAFHTEPAPKVTGATFNDAPLSEGQQAVALRGNVKVSFSQPMDAARTPVLVDGAALDPKSITWDASGQSATLAVTLGHSRTHTLAVPKTATNRKQDMGIADWTLSFTTVVQVPSAGSTARLGTSSAPIIIQIENSSQPTVRPQTGMQQADMIYEYISEFGIPRLSAIYWHVPTSLIGPVRSCRLITVQLEQMYRGMIFCSGAIDYVLGQVWKWPNVVYDYAYMYPFMYRASDRYAPHNVIARPDRITVRRRAAPLALPRFASRPRLPHSGPRWAPARSGRRSSRRCKGRHASHSPCKAALR